jgi:hypothetical protein
MTQGGVNHQDCRERATGMAAIKWLSGGAAIEGAGDKHVLACPA